MKSVLTGSLTDSAQARKEWAYGSVNRIQQTERQIEKIESKLNKSKIK